MKNYYGRRVRICEYVVSESKEPLIIADTCKIGRLLEIDIHCEHVMIEDENGNIIKLFYKLVKLI